MIEKRKVVTYITRQGKLLVFAHPFAPEAGIQVPAGTLHEGESPADGALREASEETGLPPEALRMVGFLGEQRRDMREFGIEQVQHRSVFQLTCEVETPEVWRHGECDPSDEMPRDEPIVFEFFWVRLPDEVPLLAGDQGALLPELMQRLSAP